MNDTRTARKARRRSQYRAPKEASAIKAFRNGAKNLGLSQRQYHACIARIEKASTPEREAQNLVNTYTNVRTTEFGGDLGKALTMLEACPAFRKRRHQRQDAIRRVICAAEANFGAALACAEQMLNGDHWRGTTWIPEVRGSRVPSNRITKRFSREAA